MKKCLYCAHDLFLATKISDLFNLYLFENKYLCQKCFKQFELILLKENYCLGCQKLIAKQDEYCQECLFWKEEYKVQVSNNALFRYNDFSRDFLWQIKHNRDITLALGIIPDIQNYLYKTYQLKNTLFVPIPSDRESLQLRGFNLIEYVFSNLNISINSATFFSVIESARIKQHKKGKKERRAYASMPYRLVSDFANILSRNSYAEIVLIDDVYTTGSTIIKAINTLKKKTDTKISSFTIFR